MNRRLLLLVGIIAAGGWYFLQHFELEGLSHIRIKPRGAASTPYASSNYAGPVAGRVDGMVRVASFNIQVFGESKLSQPDVMQVLAEVVRRFDIVAIQEIRATSQEVVPRFIELINSTGAHYDYAIGPRLGRSNSKEQYAFIFNTATVEIDRTSLYTVSDPDDRLHREPFVATFRARGPPATEAFTFKLVNIHTDPDEVAQELDALDDVFRAVRNDGAGEDDIIILGDLNADEYHLGELGQVPYIRWAISGVPTNTRRTKQYDNLLFDGRTSTEFTGGAGVFDLQSEFGLSLDQAVAVSDHLPVWAEFSVYEGGQAAPLATRPTEPANR